MYQKDFDNFGYYKICDNPPYYHKIYCLTEHNVEITIDLTDIKDPQVYFNENAEFDKNELGQVLLNCQPNRVDVNDSFNYKILLEWIESQFTEFEPGFNSESEENNDSDKRDIHDIKSNPNRNLTIYTWGKAYRKHAPNESQRNFNASILNGRRKGVNLKKLDGRSPEVQKVVESGTRFWSWAKSVVNNIEENDLHTISVNCTKGRHRSVAGSILLKKYFYPNTIIIHVELKSMS